MQGLSETIRRVYEEHRDVAVGRVGVSGVPGGPTDGQLESWTRLGYVTSQKVMVDAKSYVVLYTHSERFVAVVMARLIRAGLPVKMAATAARAMWEEPPVTDGEFHRYRARIFQGVHIEVVARIDGSGPSRERERR